MRTLLKSAAWVVGAFAAFLISGSSVFAADWGAKVPPPGTYDWSGFYFGGHVGGGWESTSFSDPGLFSILNNCCEYVNYTNEPGAATSATGGSFLGGAQAGWMYQFGHYVIGGDIDFSVTRIQGNGSRSFPPLGTSFVNENYSTRTDWTATSTATFGYAMGPWLFYGKAGAAWEHENYGLDLIGSDDSTPFSFGAGTSKIVSGWTGGAGVKWAISNNLFLFAEYDFLDFGLGAQNVSGKLTATPLQYEGSGPATTFSPIFDQHISQVKIGLNYKFSPGGFASSDSGLITKGPSASVYDWSGPYFGVHIGAGRQSVGFSDPSAMSVLSNCCLYLGAQGDPSAATDANANGFLGGAQAGWAYQIGHLVVGGDVDFSATDIAGNGSSSIPASYSGGDSSSANENYSVRTNWTATSTATVGLAQGVWLFYGKMGAAWADNSYGLSVSGLNYGTPFSFNSSTSRVVLGWTAGVGVKWALSSNLFLDAEYDYLDFGSRVQHIGGNLAPLIATNGPLSSAANFDPMIKQNISELKVGLNYKFASGGPLDSIVPPASGGSYDWSGAYVGAHLGGGWQSTGISDPGAYSTIVACCVLIGAVNNPTAASNANGLGVLGGAQAGWMYQIERLVVGVDVDFSGSGMKGSGTSTASPLNVAPPYSAHYSESYSTQTNWIATSTATVGIAIGKWLFYGKGGAAWADNSYGLNVSGMGYSVDGPDSSPFSYAASTNRISVGWTTGLGVKWALTDNLFVNAEYDLMDFGSTMHSFNGNFSAAPATFESGFSRNATFEPVFNQTISAVKIGLNYKFPAGIPF